MEHSFNVEVATEYGVHSAILLNNIAFWCLKNKANGTHEHDGYFWTYNSKKAFSELFPYMTARQIDYALKRLIDDGILVTGNYNANAYDRTLWYAVTKKGYSILQNCAMDGTRLSNGNTENVEPIPDDKPDEKRTDKKPDKKVSKSERLKAFDTIIEEYTDNASLQEALKSFVQMRTSSTGARFTNKALELALKKLDEYGTTDAAKVEVVNQSIMNGWKGLFPLKGQGRRMNNGTSDNGRAATDSAEIARRIGTYI